MIMALSRLGGKKIKDTVYSADDLTEETPASAAFRVLDADDPESARQIVRELSRRDRALAVFTAEELVRLCRDEDAFEEAADRRRAREDYEARPDPAERTDEDPSLYDSMAERPV